MRHGGPHQSHPFLQREQGMLVGIDSHPHHDRLKNAAGPVDHIEMTQRDRVEGACIDSGSGRRGGQGGTPSGALWLSGGAPGSRHSLDLAARIG